MLDTDGEVTTTRLRGASYVKDNRILPQGFDKLAVPADVGVFGAALDDPDFDGAGDEVTYQIEVDPDLGPFTVEAGAKGYLARGNQAVWLSTLDGRDIVIGTEQPDQFESALRTWLPT